MKGDRRKAERDDIVQLAGEPYALGIDQTTRLLFGEEAWSELARDFVP